MKKLVCAFMLLWGSAYGADEKSVTFEFSSMPKELPASLTTSDMHALSLLAGRALGGDRLIGFDGEKLDNTYFGQGLCFHDKKLWADLTDKKLPKRARLSWSFLATPAGKAYLDDFESCRGSRKKLKPVDTFLVGAWKDIQKRATETFDESEYYSDYDSYYSYYSDDDENFDRPASIVDPWRQEVLEDAEVINTELKPALVKHRTISEAGRVTFAPGTLAYGFDTRSVSFGVDVDSDDECRNVDPQVHYIPDPDKDGNFLFGNFPRLIDPAVRADETMEDADSLDAVACGSEGVKRRVISLDDLQERALRVGRTLQGDEVIPAHELKSLCAVLGHYARHNRVNISPFVRRMALIASDFSLTDKQTYAMLAELPLYKEMKWDGQGDPLDRALYGVVDAVVRPARLFARLGGLDLSTADKRAQFEQEIFSLESALEARLAHLDRSAIDDAVKNFVRVFTGNMFYTLGKLFVRGAIDNNEYAQKFLLRARDLGHCSASHGLFELYAVQGNDDDACEYVAEFLQHAHDEGNPVSFEKAVREMLPYVSFLYVKGSENVSWLQGSSRVSPADEARGRLFLRTVVECAHLVGCAEQNAAKKNMFGESARLLAHALLDDTSSDVEDIGDARTCYELCRDNALVSVQILKVLKMKLLYREGDLEGAYQQAKELLDNNDLHEMYRRAAGTLMVCKMISEGNVEEAAQWVRTVEQDAGLPVCFAQYAAYGVPDDIENVWLGKSSGDQGYALARIIQDYSKYPHVPTEVARLVETCSQDVPMYLTLLEMTTRHDLAFFNRIADPKSPLVMQDLERIVQFVTSDDEGQKNCACVALRRITPESLSGILQNSPDGDFCRKLVDAVCIAGHVEAGSLKAIYEKQPGRYLDDFRDACEQGDERRILDAIRGRFIDPSCGLKILSDFLLRLQESAVPRDKIRLNIITKTLKDEWDVNVTPYTSLGSSARNDGASTSTS